MRKYKNSINITEGLEKKKYTEQELAELMEINRKAKENFLKCFIKVKNDDETVSTQADKYSAQLLEEERSQVHLFLRSRVLVHRKYLSDGVDLARQMAKEFPNEESRQKLEEVERLVSRQKA